MDDEKQVYTYPDGTEDRLTNKEAVEAGFCPVCGYFVLGSDDDRTLYTHSMCAECLDEFRYEIGEYDDYYEDADGIGY